MYRAFSVILIFWATVLSLSAQTSSAKYQQGTIMAVEPHKNGPGESDATRYEVSVKVGDTLYVTLYTPPNGANAVEYSAGTSLLVLVGSDSLTFNSKMSGKTEVPILRREAASAKSGLDMSKAPGQYFSMKLQHLSETLNLTDEQQVKIKPILEQEANEATQVCLSPVLSQKDKLNRFEKIVGSSDEKIKPLLTAAQVQKLQDMRREQKEDVKKIIAEQKSKN